MGIYTSLQSSGFTSLKVTRGRAGFRQTLSRSWDPDLDFASYGRGFAPDLVPCEAPLRLEDEAARRLLRDASEDLARLEASLAEGGHEQVRLELHAGLDVRITTYIHSSVLGANNGLHGLRAGGLRRHDTATPEHEVFQDGLNLSRAMTYKNANAELPFGGCKLTAQCDPFPLDDSPETRTRLGFFAWVIDSARVVTGPDMGFPPELIDRLRERYTRHIMCGPGSRLGHTGGPTARGVFAALQAAAIHQFGPTGLGGRHVVVQGLGSVGTPLARACVSAGAKVSLADLDADRAQKLATELGDRSSIIAPTEVLNTPCDVLAPCAYGGLLDAETIPKLSCRLIYGGANNQLAAQSPDGERRLAQLLQQEGVLFQPDWTYTSGGVLLGSEEYRNPDSATVEAVHAHIDRVCGLATTALLSEAAAAGRTPTELAYERVDRLLAREGQE